ncbi:MAG: hypothetical protein LBJ18_02400, partial [Rickettsiales bacterium]|nr:hypothetical protein [Rickettsiales bacterium]
FKNILFSFIYSEKVQEVLQTLRSEAAVIETLNQTGEALKVLNITIPPQEYDASYHTKLQQLRQKSIHAGM